MSAPEDRDPLMALLRVRLAIDQAIDATENYNYEEFNQRLEAMRTESRELFAYFDKYYSGDDEDSGPN